MELKSFNKELNFSSDKISTSLILETSHSKEIRILLKKGQLMKEHKAPFPIIIHVLKGKIDFGFKGQTALLESGSIINLESNIPHNLNALEDSIVRLSLSKMDDEKRVENAAKA